jgi:hypothetical protein
MSQHDMNIANQTSANARADINNALGALVSLSSGTSAPSTTFANMLWYETDTNTLYIRNEANSGWVTIGIINGSAFEAKVAIASQAEAEAGTENTKTMTALRVKNAIDQISTGSIGVGQTWQSFSTSNRVNNTWYQNTTSLPIQVAINCRGGDGGGEPAIYVGTATNSYITIATWPSNDGEYERSAFSFIVPVNHYYKLTSGTRIHWSELRA